MPIQPSRLAVCTLAFAIVIATSGCSIVLQDSVRSSGLDCSESRGYMITDIVLAAGLAVAASEASAPSEGYIPAGAMIGSALIGRHKRNHCVDHRKRATPEQWAAHRDRKEAERQRSIAEAEEERREAEAHEAEYDARREALIAELEARKASAEAEQYAARSSDSDDDAVDDAGHDEHRIEERHRDGNARRDIAELFYKEEIVNGERVGVQLHNLEGLDLGEDHHLRISLYLLENGTFVAYVDDETKHGFTQAMDYKQGQWSVERGMVVLPGFGRGYKLTQDGAPAVRIALDYNSHVAGKTVTLKLGQWHAPGTLEVLRRRMNKEGVRPIF